MRTTLHQMGVVKDAVERQARSSLSQLDTVMLQRRQREALARLGEVIWKRVRNGELTELAEHGEIAAIFDELAELEESAHQDARHDAGHEAVPAVPDAGDDGTVSAADWAAAMSRTAAADRRDRGTGRRGQQDMRVWRPRVEDIPDPPDSTDRDHEPHRDASPATAGHRGSEPRHRAEVPGIPDEQEHDRPGAGARPDAPARSRSRRSRRRDDQAPGGIAFMEDRPGDEDDDLAEFMHEDDVPRRD